MNYRNKALRDLARNAPCMFRFGGICNNKPETSVWCHSDAGRHGKGTGIKAHDCFGATGCSACHAHLPTLPRPAREYEMQEAMDRQWLWMWQTAQIGVGGNADVPAEPKRSKPIRNRVKAKAMERPAYKRSAKVLEHGGYRR